MALVEARRATRHESADVVQPSPSNDRYLQWRARLAAKQEARRQHFETVAEPPPSPSSSWDPALLFEHDETPAPGARPAEPESAPTPRDVIDLRVAESPVLPEAFDPAVSKVVAPSRRRALAAQYTRTPRAPSPSTASTADLLRQLNEQRLTGVISEDEFKARKAELFGAQH
jgi:hypothetical protein